MRENQVTSADATDSLIDRLVELRRHTSQVERAQAGRLDRVCQSRRASARNLIHYVSMRQQELRPLQEELMVRGLSSLGRCEANVQATLNAVIDILCQLSGREHPPIERAEVEFVRSRELLDDATAALFDGQPVQGAAHIMVTMPSEAARDRVLVGDLVEQGMDCMRINCAHDGPEAWLQMIAKVREASECQRRPCRVAMDLGGPKLRTGPIESGPAVVKWRPRRDELGRVLAPARIWLHRQSLAGTPPLPADAVLPVDADWPADVCAGEELRFTDARGRSRIAVVTEVGEDGVWVESTQTAYVTPETVLNRATSGEDERRSSTKIGALPPSEQYLVLRRGDHLLLGDDHMIGAPARYDAHGRLVRPARIGCTLPSIFQDVAPGERVLFDDGTITARIEEVHSQHLVLEVTEAQSNGTKLRADKGINLPDTDLHLDALTDKDLEDLAFVVEHADIVSYSFVRRAQDVERLQDELQRLGRPKMPIILKIENRQAFECLPSLLLTVMRSPVSGVMIARGDLAVELGWQRLAEVQEEILWMCEAAHIPVVWATQVLDNLAKTGIPSRSEITDAAMGVRAECVMLNKGPHILEAVRVLSDILRRMKDHQVKKRSLFRRLKIADDLRLSGQQTPTADAGKR